jgi:hypothetical protein
MSKSLFIIIMLGFMLPVSNAEAQSYAYRKLEKKLPWYEKYLSIGLGVEQIVVNLEDNGSILGPGSRFSPTFSIQTGIYPIMAEFRVNTDPSFDFAAGGYLPFTRLGSGWLIASPFAFYRLGQRSIISDFFEGEIISDLVDNLGLAARLEYLIFQGTLSFYVEVRQTVFNPWETSFCTGISWSPLMFLMIRDM